jgi:hypothetical protein
VIFIAGKLQEHYQKKDPPASDTPILRPPWRGRAFVDTNTIDA